MPEWTFAAAYGVLAFVVLVVVRELGREHRDDTETVESRSRLVRELRNYGSCGQLRHDRDCNCDRGTGEIVWPE